jgi:hypothetical protein
MLAWTPRSMPASTMSSETSTEPQRPHSSAPLEAWQLFTLAGLLSAAIVAFRAGAQPSSARVFLILTIFAAAAVGVAALRMLLPFANMGGRDQRLSLGERTRAVLEREKVMALRTIKELEFDRAMGKVSERDYQEMSARLRARAGRILRQLDAGGDSPYRDAIEQEITRRIGSPETPASAVTPSAASPPAVTAHPCSSCGVDNDTDARFCKACGARLETTV